MDAMEVVAKNFATERGGAPLKADVPPQAQGGTSGVPHAAPFS
ncbi:hypothetical protein [Pontibacter flavimaris]|nr:hypothetical protein [Pontibacter flavimaris]